MTMHVYWDSQQRHVLCAEAQGVWTWDEYYQAIQQMAEQIRTLRERVDIINIRGKGAQMPRGSAIPHFQRALKLLPNNAGAVVNVTTTPFARVMASVFIKLYPGTVGKKVFFVASIEEARAFIARQRQNEESANL